MNKYVAFTLFMGCQLICCFSLSLISPFFPPFAEKRGISESTIGYIFSSNPVGAVVASLILGKIMNISNRIKFMLFALIFQSFGLYLFVVTKFIENNSIFILIAVLARLINGFATSLFLTPLYAQVPLLFPEAVEKWIGISELFSALGYLLGPVVGSLLYNAGGYTLPFLFFGSLSLIFVPFMGMYFKKKQELIEDEGQNISLRIQNAILVPGNDSILQNDLNVVEMISYKDVLKQYPIVMMTFCSITVFFQFNFLQPIFAPFLEKTYNIDPDDVGFYMSVMPLFYMIGAITASSIQNNKIIIIFIAAILNGVSAIFIGPDKILTRISNKLYISLVSSGGIGFFSSFMIIYTVPVINDYLYLKYPSQKDECANIASAFGSFIGELLGPITSGYLTSAFGFGHAMAISGFVVLAFALFFIPVLKIQPKCIQLEQLNRQIKAQELVSM